MDIHMPVMDGIEASMRIIQEYGHDAPPIVAMTANVFKENRIECYNVGMQDFISKPIKSIELKRVFQKFRSHNDHNLVNPNLCFDQQALENSFYYEKIALIRLVEEFIEHAPLYKKNIITHFQEENHQAMFSILNEIKELSASLCSAKLVSLVERILEKTGKDDFNIEPDLRKLNIEIEGLCVLMKSIYLSKSSVA
jgi:CheY-like chemotaxis protein